MFETKLKAYTDEIRQLDVFVMLSMKAFESRLETRQLEEMWLTDVVYGAEMRQFAIEQLDSGMPYVYNLAAIRCWSMLEAMIDDLLVNWAFHYKTANLTMRADIRERYDDLINDEPAEEVADAVKKKVDKRNRSKSQWLVELLDAVGLTGEPMPDELLRATDELWYTRNVLVHNNGRVDTAFVRWCPNAGRKEGDVIELNGADHEAFKLAVQWWLCEATDRWHRLYNRKPDAVPLSEIAPEFSKEAAAEQLNALINAIARQRKERNVRGVGRSLLQ